QPPIVNFSIGAAFAFNGSGPMGSVTIVPVSIGDTNGLQLGVGFGGWMGRLSNDAFESSHRQLYGTGVRAELRLPSPSKPVSSYVRASADFARSSVSNANFVIQPPLPGDYWDRSSGEGMSLGIEAGIAIRIEGSTHLQVAGSYDHQSL